MKTRTPFHALAVAASLALAGAAACAQSAGTVMVKIGINQITPQVTSGDLSAPSQPGTKVDVKAATGAILTGTYMLTDNVSLEAYVGSAYKHEMDGAGAIAGVGKLGSVEQVSPTVFAQYRLLDASAPLRPYAGLGLTYAYFFHGEGSGTLTSLTNPGGSPTRLSVDGAWGLSPQVGVSYRLNDHWFVDAFVIKTFLKTTSHLSTGQSISTRLDPVSAGLSIGYRY
jgi:outer membrane protein